MRLRSFFLLHISIFLFSFTAILGDIIQLSLVSLVWWRVFLSIAILSLILGPMKLFRNLSRKLWWRHIIIGLLVSVHWLSFYGSIKISNASIVLIAMSTTSFITALLEPLFIKSSKWRSFDLLISIMIIPAMILIYYNATEVQQTGLWIGLFSAFIGAVFSILNKMWIEKDKELEITFVQLGTVAVSISLLIFGMILFSVENAFEVPTGIDWIYFLIFAGVCTVLAYMLYLRSMHWLTAFDVSFAFNMEPVYGLVMAALILSDYQELSLKIYVGMGFILFMVLIHTYLKSGKSVKWV